MAGRELLADGRPGAWVRPVSARPDQETSPRERQYADRSEPRLLDVIDVPVLRARPKDYQQENWLLDPNRKWARVRRLAPGDLAELADPPATLWIDGHSSANGRNDRVPLAQTTSLDSSLRLIWVDRLEIFVSQPGLAIFDDKQRLQGRFRWSGADYWLRITDPVLEQQYAEQPNGQYGIGECYLTVSLGEPYNGHSYKLIAAVIDANGGDAA